MSAVATKRKSPPPAPTRRSRRVKYASPTKQGVAPLDLGASPEELLRAAENPKKPDPFAKTPSPRRAEAAEIVDHGKLYKHKMAFDMLFVQDCKEYRKPLSENYPQVDMSAAAKLIDLGTIRENIGKGVYNSNPQAIRDDTQIVFQNVLDTAVGVFSPGMRKKATKMLKFIEKAFAETFDIEQKFTPKPTAMRAMAVVKARAEAYIYGTCSQFLWMRPIGAGATEQWVKLGRAPTETVDLCYHDAARQLYSVDMYGSMWVMDLAAESPSWASIEATKGAKLCAITVLDGVLYGATSKKIVQRPVSAAGWKDLLTPSGEVLEAHDVVGLAAQDGKLYAYNDADELWSLELDLRADWELLAGALLPGTNGLCLSGVHMLSANFDTLWERPLAAVNCFTIKGSLPQSDVKVTRRVAKTPSRMLKYDRTQQGNKKPILGIYTNSEYRKPSKGFDLPEVGRAVLDLGAHIGWFTLWCLDNGASSVIAVEATPQSHGFHAANFKDDPRVTSIHAAAVSQASFDQSPTATFRIAPMGNTWRNCLDKYTYWNEKTTATMGSVTVPCVSVPQLLKEHPEVHMVKIDIEGSEMELLEEIVWPEHVEYLVFEYSVGTRCCHLACPGCVEKGCPPTCSKVRFPPIREKLEAQGFYVQFAPSYWSVITGKKSAVYDEIIFCKRVQAPQQHLIGMNVD